MEVCKWVVECNNKVREALLQKGRVYRDFVLCKVVDFLSVPRCCKCQGYGNVSKYCTKTVEGICAHCAEEIHGVKEWKALESNPVCAVYKVAEKLTRLKVGQ